MAQIYTISEFYTMLKLGIWTSGEVLNWGRVDMVAIVKGKNTDNLQESANSSSFYMDPFLKKTLNYYIPQIFSKRILANGIYLLDIYVFGKQAINQGEKQLKTYILVLSTGRLGLENREYTYILKTTNYYNEINFTSVFNEGKRAHKRKSYFRKKSSSNRFEFNPIHSVERKH